jgi:hypothetical protein
MTGSCVRKGVVLGLGLVVALFMTSVVQSQESKKDKVKLTGAELQQRASKYFVIAGYNVQTDCSFMIVNSGDGKTRKQYWDCLSPLFGSGTSNGTFRVVGDKECSKYEAILGGQERCAETYQIGEDKYEFWYEQLPQGSFERAGIYYRLK